MWRDLIERSLWTGVQSGLAIITVDGLTGLDAAPGEMLLVAGVAVIITALKVLSTGRLNELSPAQPQPVPPEEGPALDEVPVDWDV